jgi:ubiquinone/menaquinone biosynthesis C-methylase UbiE
MTNPMPAPFLRHHIEGQYWQYREPYLPKFFSVAAEEMGLSHGHRLLDLGCGGGAVAFGFAPFVGSTIGVDIDEHALAVARTEAERRNLKIDFIHGGPEDLADDLAPIDVVTIGRALAYLPREATLARFDRLISPGGHVLICETTTHDGLSGPWAVAYRLTRRRWTQDRPRFPRPQVFMEGSPFVFKRVVGARRSRQVSVEELVLRAVAFPLTTPEILGPRTDEFMQGVRAAISRDAVDGVLTEVIQTNGSIFQRTGR